MLAKNLWIFLQAAIFLVVLYSNFSYGRSLVKPPRPLPPTAPKPGTRFFRNSTSVPGPTCTTIDDVPNGIVVAGTNVTSRNGLTGKNYRWTSFNVHPDAAYEQWELDIINTAMWNLWQVIPCVRFGIYRQQDKPSGDYMKLIKGTNNGCNSYVGRQGGKQDINLQSPGCMTVGTVMHELLHALGFYHEHCRPDRDDFLWLYWDNVFPEYKHAFDKQTEPYTSTFGVPYNEKSIMHYESWAFSKNGLATMLSKNGQTIGSVGELQQTDIQKLKAMYNC